MKILVPIKRVPDPTQKAKIKDGHIDLSGASWIVNTFDEYAVETALRLLENGETTTRTGGEIIVVTLGPDDAAKELRTCLAMGADRAIHVGAKDEEIDALVVVKVLSAIVAAEKPDLVIMGKQAVDGDANQVGQMLAGKLRWPQATFAASIELQDKTLVVGREVDGGVEYKRVPTPSVITVDLRIVGAHAVRNGVTPFLTDLGPTMRRSTVTTAGAGTRLYSTPPSTSRPTSSDCLSPASSIDAANVACGQPSLAASIWPTWLASPSTACLPMTTRSGFSAAMMPCSTFTTTSESICSSLATTWIARSAPIASVVRSSFAASSGPIVTTTISPPVRALVSPFSSRRSAVSTAYSSNVLTIQDAPVRSMWPSLILAFCVGSGTRLTGTRIFMRTPCA